MSDTVKGCSKVIISQKTKAKNKKLVIFFLHFLALVDSMCYQFFGKSMIIQEWHSFL